MRSSTIRAVVQYGISLPEKRLRSANKNARRGGQARVPCVPAAKCGERTESAQDTANFSYQYADFDS